MERYLQALLMSLSPDGGGDSGGPPPAQGASFNVDDDAGGDVGDDDVEPKKKEDKSSKDDKDSKSDKDSKPVEKDGDKPKKPAEKYVGKSQEELLKIIKDHENFNGKQSREVGELRRLVAELQSKIDGSSKPASKADSQPVNEFAKQREALRTKLDSSEITFEKYSTELAAIAAHEATYNTITRVEAEKAQAAERASQDKFLAENPDFTEMFESGVLDKVVKSNPVMNPVAAYYAIKAAQASEQYDNLVAKYNEIVAKVEKQVKSGGKVQDKVMADGNPLPKDRDKRPTSEAFDHTSVSQSMVAAMRRARGA